MHPITYYVQTPAIDALVRQYGNYLSDLSRQDRLSFLRILVNYLASSVEVEPDGTKNAVEAWWLIAEESVSAPPFLPLGITPNPAIAPTGKPKPLTL
jgi:hypothetical protein